MYTHTLVGLSRQPGKPGGCFRFHLVPATPPQQEARSSSELTHQAVLLDTTWVSCNSFEFRLEMDVVGSHELRAQTHEVAPTSDASLRSQVATCTSDVLAINGGSRGALHGLVIC